MKDLIIFDLDRTIYNGSIGQEFIIHLVSKNFISPKIIAQLTTLLVEYESEVLNYEETVKKILYFLAQELVGTEFETIRLEAENFIKANHFKFYDFAFELPKVYQEFDYLILSLEPDFLVEEVCKIIGIENAVGNKFSHNNKFDTNYKITTDKLQLLNSSKFSNYSIFAAFGDSISDYEILKKAKHPIMVNPDGRLKKIGDEENFISSDPKIMYEIFKKLVA